MDLADETLALGLEAVEGAALQGRPAVVGPFPLGGDPGAEKVRGARLDVVDDELQLAEPAERPAGRLVVGRAALLVCAPEALDLRPEPADVAAQAVDQGLEEQVELAVRVPIDVQRNGCLAFLRAVFRGGSLGPRSLIGV